MAELITLTQFFQKNNTVSILKKAVLLICSYFSFLCSEEHNVIFMYSCYLVGCPHSQGKIDSQASFCQIQKTVFLCRTLHVCIHKVGTRVLLSLNIAVFLALLLLLEDQSAVTSSAGTKGNDPLDTAMAMTILLRATSLSAELATSK